MAELDPLVVLARRALLDALEALGPQRDAAVLCGAQAIYLHVGDADFAVSPFTTDADIGLRIDNLLPDPALGEAMQKAGFTAGVQPGIWISPDGIEVDLLVPDSQGGGGKRGARLGEPHGSRAARKVRGLEAVVVDYARQEIPSFDLESDNRSLEVAVAGPAGLLVSKLHKVAERADVGGRRLKDKDALDILRLLQGVPLQVMKAGFSKLMADRLSQSVTVEALEFLRRDFGVAGATGLSMIVRGLAGLEDPDVASASCMALVEELLETVNA